jgi:DoxX-like family
MNVALWIVQALLALLFLFAGGMKLVLPIEELTKQMPLVLPGWFVRFTGVIEVLGGIGVIVPWLTGIRPALTPLAAAGLVLVMIGAVVYGLLAGDLVSALLPLVVGMLAAFVAYGRWKVTPQPGASQPSVLQPSRK